MKSAIFLNRWICARPKHRAWTIFCIDQQQVATELHTLGCWQSISTLVRSFNRFRLELYILYCYVGHFLRLGFRSFHLPVFEIL